MDAQDALRDAPKHAKAALMETSNDAEMVDVLALINNTAQELQVIKRGSLSEIDSRDQPKPGTVEGDSFVMKRSRSAKRSYNTTGLLLDLSAATSVDFLEILHILHEQDILRMEWQWQKLEAYAYEVQMPIKKAPKEIEEGDPDFHVGEVWTEGSASFKPNA